MRLSLRGFDQREPFTAPMADRGDDDLPQRTTHRALDARLVGRRIKFTTAHRDRGQSHIHRKLWFEPMPDVGASGANGNLRMLHEECALLGGGGAVPLAPDSTAVSPGLSRAAMLSHSRFSALVTSPGARLQRSDSTAESRA